MNTLESYLITSPFGMSEECAKFTIDDVFDPFILSDILVVGQEYTLSFWAMSEASGGIYAPGITFQLSSEWTKYKHTFTARETNLLLQFNAAGTYYIYHAQLEKGNIATDWTPDPDDIYTKNETESAIKMESDRILLQVHEMGTATNAAVQLLSDQLATLVTDENGASMMTQTPNGWVFNMSAINQTLNDTSEALNDLSGKIDGTDSLIERLDNLVSDLSKKTAYIIMATDGNGDPCIELGKIDNDFKVRITNTSVDFMEGSSRIAYVNNKSLYIEKAVIKDELQIGEGSGFVWKRRSNGNLGLRWIGG